MAHGRHERVAGGDRGDEDQERGDCRGEGIHRRQVDDPVRPADPLDCCTAALEWPGSREPVDPWCPAHEGRDEVGALGLSGREGSEQATNRARARQRGCQHTTQADRGTVAWSGEPEYNRGMRGV